MRGRVLVCDRAWPDLEIERSVLGGAGLDVVEAPNADEGSLVRLAADVSAIMTCFARVTASVIGAPSDLRIVARFGTGVDMIDVDAAIARGAVVTNVPDYCSEEVAEHALALILASLRGVVAYDRALRAGRWGLDEGDPPRRLAGSTLGIIGFGAIGRALARKASALGVRVLVRSRHAPAREIAATGAQAADLDDLLAASDVVSVHLPLDRSTRHLVGEAFLEKMQPHALLVNTSRGPIVDEAALAAALAAGRIGGAALDVFEEEPPPPGSPLLRAARTVLTPHLGFYSREAVERMRRLACEDVVRAMRGGPVERPVGGSSGL